MAEEKIVKALLYAPAEPDATQKKRFTDFIVKKYGEDIPFEWIEDKNLSSGFKLVVGEEVYDWTNEGRLHQLEGMLRELKEEKVSIKSITGRG